MPFVLTTAGSVRCPDPVAGTVNLVSAAKLSVAGQPVLLAADVVSQPLVGCGVVDNPAQGIKHCTSVVAVTGGISTKLVVGGRPVLLDTLTGTTDGTPPPLGKPLGLAAAGQTKLTTP